MTGGNEGVLLEFQQFDVTLPRHFYENEYQGYELFCEKGFRELHKFSRSSFKHPLFQIKISEFENASVLGISVWHSLSDGTTFFNFIQLISQLYRGLVNLTSAPRTFLDSVRGAVLMCLLRWLISGARLLQ